VCVGAVVRRNGLGNLLIWAKQVVLAAGGCGMVYRETTNPPSQTGTGWRAAYRAGRTRDMEFMQFHPTVLYVAGSARYLVSEAVRGEGAVPAGRETATGSCPPKTHGRSWPPATWSPGPSSGRWSGPSTRTSTFDLSHLDPEMVRDRGSPHRQGLPGVRAGHHDDRIPVRPGAHYMIGGVTVDTSGGRPCRGCGRAGEVTSSGLHGANRLASTACSKGWCMGGVRPGAAEAARGTGGLAARPIRSAIPPPETADTLDVADLTNALRAMMVRRMGIVRDAGGWRRRSGSRVLVTGTPSAGSSTGSRWELQNLLTVASADDRRGGRRDESRGTHFPQRLPGEGRRPLGPPATWSARRR